MDNYTLWEQHEADQEKKLAKLPKCCLCGEPIQQESAIRISGKWYCDDCLEYHREYIEEE